MHLIHGSFCHFPSHRCAWEQFPLEFSSALHNTCAIHMEIVRTNAHKYATECSVYRAKQLSLSWNFSHFSPVFRSNWKIRRGAHTGRAFAALPLWKCAVPWRKSSKSCPFSQTIGDQAGSRTRTTFDPGRHRRRKSRSQQQQKKKPEEKFSDFSPTLIGKFDPQSSENVRKPNGLVIDLV